MQVEHITIARVVGYGKPWLFLLINIALNDYTYYKSVIYDISLHPSTGFQVTHNSHWFELGLWPHKTFAYQQQFFVIFSDHRSHQTAGRVSDMPINITFGCFPFLAHHRPQLYLMNFF